MVAALLPRRNGRVSALNRLLEPGRQGLVAINHTDPIADCSLNLVFKERFFVC